MSKIDLIKDEQTKQFAEACHDMNSTQELREALLEIPDTVDMKTWGISAEQWREAISAALHDRLEAIQDTELEP